MHALILAGGQAPTRARLDGAWPGWNDDIELVVAADGGAGHADRLETTLDLWVGDGDSLDAEALAGLVAAGIAVQLARPDKDESDTELAVRAALDRGATRLTIVGALGGPRLDHALANVALLAMDELGGRDVRLIDQGARVRCLRAPDPTGAAASLVLEGRIGDVVSLLPWGGAVTGISTLGLHYPLRDEVLVEGRSRGLSNVRIAATASVTVRDGRLIVIESPASL
jgi:thiamine pyrophosphokinase